MIVLEHVTKRYGDTLAVDDLSLEIAKGELAVLLGRSGCGKTTTLRAINRMHDIDEGTITVDGVNVMERSPDELRRHIGYVIQSVGLFPHMTVARNIGVVPRLLGWDGARIEARVNELIELVGLDVSEHARKKPGQLSGGQQQRVGVARALAADPPVLLMDEPFGALDPISRQRLQAEFLRLQRELRKTVVFVTHDVEEAVVLGDRIALMDGGKLVQFDTPERLWQHPATPLVTQFFGHELGLKIMSRHTVGDVRLEPGDGAGLVQIAAEDSLKDALALLVSSGGRGLAVRNGDGAVRGVVTFAAIVDAMREQP